MHLLARLDRLPFSRPHYLLLILGGLGFTFDSADVTTIAFSIPALREEWGLSLTQAGLINSVTPVGWLIGAILAGAIGDRFGRKPVMLYALVFYCIFTVVGALSTSYEMFLAARLIAGIGLGAEAAIIAPFLSEFVPAKKRGLFVGVLSGFFAFGSLLAALNGRFVIASFDDGWRYAQLLTAVPVVMVLVWRRTLSESPRYLLRMGRKDEARAVVEDMERRVERATGRPLPPVPEVEAETHAVVQDDEQPSVGFGRGLAYVWQPALRKRTTAVWTIWLVFVAVTSGFNTWIPTLLVERGLDIQQSFTYSIGIYAAQIPGYFAGAWLAERYDRKFAIAGTLAAGGASALLLATATTNVVLVTGGVLFTFFLQAATAGIYAYTPEQYPTWVRATGNGLASAVGRVGSISSPFLIGLLVASAGFVGIFGTMTALLAVAVIVLLAWGPRTAGLSLEEISAKAGAVDAPTAGRRGTTRA